MGTKAFNGSAEGLVDCLRGGRRSTLLVSDRQGQSRGPLRFGGIEGSDGVEKYRKKERQERERDLCWDVIKYIWV